ncbi:MAG: Stp1/IreP family PP2C-type Ser/Thr phosphatase [Gammaproteobacteria bacterium]|nr:MAG: Stp1/IreP family PP2C-type Ser/Thr phosphatase [Gammaproteobacteria bacterium]
MDLTNILEIVAKTDIGRKREHNEDSVGADSAYGFVIVADGMGGHNAGEVASGIAANVIYESVKHSLEEITTGMVDDESGYALESLRLREAAESANRAINETAKQKPECGGMGTTVVAGIFYDNRMSIAHVGDSRVYRLRGKKLDQLTRDHSLVQELVDRGFYANAEEAEAAGNKNLITRAMGVEPEVLVDIQEEVVQTGDIYLLCSDGLYEMVSDEKIYLTLKEFSANLTQAAEILIKIANENGGKDNISVVLVRPTRSFATKRNWYGRFIDWFS